MREIIHGRLWLGNAIESRDIKRVLDLGVQAIVDVAADEPLLEKLPRDIVYCRFPLVDGDGNDPVIIRAAVQTTAAFIREATPTLVFCSAGLSRSPSVVAAALARARGIEPHVALAEVADTGPSQISPVLWQQIVTTCFR